MCLCVLVHVCLHGMAHTQKLEDVLWELILFFFSVLRGSESSPQAWPQAICPLKGLVG